MEHLSETQTLKQFLPPEGKVNSTPTRERSNTMNRDILEKPFTQDQIKHREGNFGKMLAYVEGHAVIQRLNDAFDARWSFTVQRSEIINETDEVMVLGQLEADGIVKCQFGSSRITRSRQSGEMVSLADDFKAATTDALKKCATMFGVALHLYNGDNSGNGPSRNNGNGNAPGHIQGYNHGNGSGNGKGHNNGNGSGDHSSNNGNRLSGKQYKYLIQLNDKMGRNKSDLDQQCISMFGTAAQYLSKNDASSIIEHLLAS